MAKMYSKKVVQAHFTAIMNFVSKRMSEFKGGKYEESNFLYPQDEPAFQCFVLQYIHENYIKKYEEEKVFSDMEAKELYSEVEKVLLFDDYSGELYQEFLKERVN